ncbi:hypothetical protein CRUP_008630, partial [Coryphaenoides rupestris]
RVSLAYTGRSLTLESASAAATGLGASLPPPSLLSPHSKLHVSGALAEHLIPQVALSSQHRGFSPVGQRLKGAASLQASLSASRLEEVDSAAAPPTAADRSDELTVRRGDVIQVLYKDNHNWWFGRLAGGQQGYFPAAYVSAAISSSGELRFLSEQDTEPELATTKSALRKKKVKRHGAPPVPSQGATATTGGGANAYAS